MTKWLGWQGTGSKKYNFLKAKERSWETHPA
jgi:hypothetical protein